MHITEAQQKKVERINQFVKIAVTDEKLLEGMYDYMLDFKSLMDDLPNGGIDFLSKKYSEFFRFSMMLELLAEGIESGKIKVQ